MGYPIIADTLSLRQFYKKKGDSSMPVIPKLEYKGSYSKTIGLKGTDAYDIPFYKPKEYFISSDNYTRFVKACEQNVRRHEDYTVFKNWVTNVVGIDFCQITPNVKLGDATIEMHHAFFNLYDTCSIVLNKRIECGEKVTTFAVADEVLDEHFACHIPVVMLATTNHEAVTNRDIWLNVKSGFGYISQFIEKYAPYMGPVHKNRIMTAIKLSYEIDSFDNNIFDDTDRIKRVMKKVD